MPHAIWKGAISFGLVHVPVALYPASLETGIDFEQSLNLTTAGALIVLHDVAVSQPGFGVKRLFTELDGNLYNKILIPAWPGLGIVQRKGEPIA